MEEEGEGAWGRQEGPDSESPSGEERWVWPVAPVIVALTTPPPQQPGLWEESVKCEGARCEGVKCEGLKCEGVMAHQNCMVRCCT